MTDCKPIISLRHIVKRFDDVTVLDDINLDIYKGEFVTFLGPSGCGKTTLLRTIAGFVNPTEGELLMDGRNLQGVPPNERRLNTVFQRYALFPHLDVYDNVAFGMNLRKMDSETIDKRVRKMLKLVSMSDYEERDVESLSGGQQQRVAIARALANSPQVLLLDEPLSALDLKMRKDMQIELKEMHRKLGITFIYITHDQEEALTLSDRIVVMNEGRILQVGTPADIYNEPCNSFVADFIGESNILNATMVEDRKVEFIGHEFECVDEGFGEDVPVDVVIRPEDIYIMNKLDAAQFVGTVKSCTFKGVHYEMFVETEEGYEMQIQDYNPFEVGSTVGMLIKPQDIQVMHKERVANVFPGEMTSDHTVCFLNAEFECRPVDGFQKGDKVNVTVAFDKVELMDHEEQGNVSGEVHQLLYKGNHYHLQVKTLDLDYVYVDTNDIWDKGDMVGVRIPSRDIKLSRRNED